MMNDPIDVERGYPSEGCWNKLGLTSAKMVGVTLLVILTLSLLGAGLTQLIGLQSYISQEFAIVFTWGGIVSGSFCIAYSSAPRGHLPSFSSIDPLKLSNNSIPYTPPSFEPSKEVIVNTEDRTLQNTSNTHPPGVQVIDLALNSNGENLSSQESEIPPKDVPSSLPSIPKERKPLEKGPYIQYQYPPHQHTMIAQYYQALGSAEEAKKLIQREGKEPGDYVIYTAGNRLLLLFLNAEKQLIEETIQNPFIWVGGNYSDVYDRLRYPLCPEGIDPSTVHHAMLGYKYRAIATTIESEGQWLFLGRLGLIHEFLHWCLQSPEPLCFQPAYFFKVIGHLFALVGNYPLLYRGLNTTSLRPYEIQLEGYSSYNLHQGRSLLMTELLRYVENSDLDKELAIKIQKMAHHAYIADGTQHETDKLDTLWALLQENVPITLFTGYAGHCVNITLTKTRLIYTNKGEGSGQKPGQHIYSIGKPLTKDLLEQLMAPQEKSFFPDFSHPASLSPLEKLLGLEYDKEKGYHHSPPQKSGCCVFANNKMALKAALLALGMDTHKAHKTHKEFIHQMQGNWLNHLIDLSKQMDQTAFLQREFRFLLLYIAVKLQIHIQVGKKSPSTADHPLEHNHQLFSYIVKHTRTLLENELDCPYLLAIIALKNKKPLQTHRLTPAHKEILDKASQFYGSYYYERSRALFNDW